MAQVGNKSGVRVDISQMSVMMRRKKILDDLSLSFVSSIFKASATIITNS